MSHSIPHKCTCADDGVFVNPLTDRIFKVSDIQSLKLQVFMTSLHRLYSKLCLLHTRHFNIIRTFINTNCLKKQSILRNRTGDQFSMSSQINMRKTEKFGKILQLSEILQKSSYLFMLSPFLQSFRQFCCLVESRQTGFRTSYIPPLQAFKTAGSVFSPWLSAQMRQLKQ